MKKIIFVIFSMVISIPLWARDLEQPNFVECKDKGGTLKLVYTTTSHHGKPAFSYSRLADGHLSRKVEAHGNSIQRTNTVLGEIISAMDETLSVPDATAKWVSLVLPQINLITKDPRNPDAEDPAVEFKTVVVETTTRTSFGGPQIVPGVIEDSQYFDVTCRATIALFAKPGNR